MLSAKSRVILARQKGRQFWAPFRRLQALVAPAVRIPTSPPSSLELLD
jgi:hypothetical protein